MWGDPPPYFFPKVLEISRFGPKKVLQGREYGISRGPLADAVGEPNCECPACCAGHFLVLVA
jgi:hypothetical protein